MEGINAKRLDMTESSLGDTQLILEEQKSYILDLDIAKVASDLTNMNYGYELSLKVGSAMMSTSLLNFL